MAYTQNNYPRVCFKKSFFEKKAPSCCSYNLLVGMFFGLLRCNAPFKKKRFLYWSLSLEHTLKTDFFSYLKKKSVFRWNCSHIFSQKSILYPLVWLFNKKP